MKPQRLIMADGLKARDGMLVVIDRPAYEKAMGWAAGDDLVHEITSLGTLVELGPKQIGVRYLRRAPKGSAVTCRACAGWRVFQHWLRRTNAAQRGLRERTGDYALILRSVRKEGVAGNLYEVTHLDRGILTAVWPTPEEAAEEALRVVASDSSEET